METPKRLCQYFANGDHFCRKEVASPIFETFSKIGVTHILLKEIICSQREPPTLLPCPNTHTRAHTHTKKKKKKGRLKVDSMSVISLGNLSISVNAEEWYCWRMILVLIRMSIRAIVFLFLQENICCGYSLEVPQRGTSYEYPQHVFREK